MNQKEWQDERDLERQHKMQDLKDLLYLANTSFDDHIRRAAIDAAQTIRNSDRYLQVNQRMGVHQENGVIYER